MYVLMYRLDKQQQQQQFLNSINVKHNFEVLKIEFFGYNLRIKDFSSLIIRGKNIHMLNKRE